MILGPFSRIILGSNTEAIGQHLQCRVRAAASRVDDVRWPGPKTSFRLPSPPSLSLSIHTRALHSLYRLGQIGSPLECLPQTISVARAHLSLLPLSRGNACSSTSPPVRYLDDPWLFFCFFLSDLLAKGSILSTKVPAPPPEPDPDDDPPGAPPPPELDPGPPPPELPVELDMSS